MSYSTDSYTPEDTCTFPMYQRLRKLNPYAYYSLDAQKQMQQDLREAGSLVFFKQDKDILPEPDEAVGLISLPDALSEADQMIETGDADFHERAETVLDVLYATDHPSHQAISVKRVKPQDTCSHDCADDGSMLSG